MAAKAKWSRESALTYLREHNLLTKPEESYTTDYAKRIASQHQRQVQSGAPFSRAKARGQEREKTRAKVQHHDADPQMHHIEQYFVEVPPGQSLEVKDLKNLTTRTKNKPDNFMLKIRGIVYYADPQGNLHEQEKFISVPARHQDVAAWLKENADKDSDTGYSADILQFGEDAVGLVWVEINLVAFAYPKEMRMVA